jgi:hypothetical protein
LTIRLFDSFPAFALTEQQVSAVRKIRQGIEEQRLKIERILELFGK